MELKSPHVIHFNTEPHGSVTYVSLGCSVWTLWQTSWSVPDYLSLWQHAEKVQGVYMALCEPFDRALTLQPARDARRETVSPLATGLILQTTAPSGVKSKAVPCTEQELF